MAGYYKQGRILGLSNAERASILGEHIGEPPPRYDDDGGALALRIPLRDDERAEAIASLLERRAA